MAVNQLVALAPVLRSGGFGQISPDAQKKLIEWDNKLQSTIDTLGNIQAAITKLGSNVVIDGRAGTLQTSLQNINATGNLASTDNIVSDGTGSPLAGGKRAAVAIDTNNRLTNSFRQNPVDVSSSPLSSTGLSNDGVSTVITIDAGSYQFGPGSVAYNSGSVDPGVFGGPDIEYFDDPTFSGGAVTFHFTTNPADTVGALGRIPVGSITTTNGSSGTGGGYSGGSAGKGGGRGYSGL